MSTPTITHLQAQALDLLSNEINGRDLRKRLKEVGCEHSRAAFYHLMARLEEMGLVRGRYENTEIAGQVVRERKYMISAEGSRALEDAVMFYRSLNLGVSQ